MANPLHNINEALLRRQDVERLTAMGRSALFERLNPRSKYFDPDFPRPVSVGGPNSLRWVQSEVQSYIAKKIHQSRQAA